MTTCPQKVGCSYQDDCEVTCPCRLCGEGRSDGRGGGCLLGWGRVSDQIDGRRFSHIRRVRCLWEIDPGDAVGTQAGGLGQEGYYGSLARGQRDRPRDSKLVA